jgi:hypothetical protein
MKALGIALGAVLLLAPTALGRHDTRPTLALVDRAPVVIRGTGFGARERVVLQVRTGVLHELQRTRATSRGAFLVRIDGGRIVPCSMSVVATGARGHVARLKLALRECPEPIIDP